MYKILMQDNIDVQAGLSQLKDIPGVSEEEAKKLINEVTSQKKKNPKNIHELVKILQKRNDDLEK